MHVEREYGSVNGKLVVINKLSGQPGWNTHTVEELFAIPLEKSRRLIRPVPEDLSASYIKEKKEFDSRMTARCKKAFVFYKALRAKQPSCWLPYDPENKLDIFRWWLHLKLLRWGVIV